MTLNLDGLIPATVLPMHADGGIDEPALRSYIGWVAGQGPVALAINVDTGEGPHLTHDEKVRVLRIVREVTDLPIVAGLAGPSTDAAVRQATDFKAAGADALLVFPIPAYLSEPLDARVPVGYHEAIAEVGLPMILFQLQPALAGLNFEPDTLRAMASVDGRRRDQGGLVRRPTVRRHGPPHRRAAPADHAADRQRQLHPRVVHARRDRRAHRLRRGDDARAGRHDRGLERGPDRRGAARSGGGCSGSPTSCSPGRSATTASGSRSACASSACSRRPTSAARCCRSTTPNAPSWPSVLAEVGLLASAGSSATEPRRRRSSTVQARPAPERQWRSPPWPPNPQTS